MPKTFIERLCLGRILATSSKVRGRWRYRDRQRLRPSTRGRTLPATRKRLPAAMGRSGKPCDERDHHGIYYRIQEEYGRTAGSEYGTRPDAVARLRAKRAADKAARAGTRKRKKRRKRQKKNTISAALAVVASTPTVPQPAAQPAEAAEADVVTPAVAAARSTSARVAEVGLLQFETVWAAVCHACALVAGRQRWFDGTVTDDGDGRSTESSQSSYRMGTMRADAIRRLVALMEDLGLDTIFDIGSGYGIVVYVLLLLGFEADGVEICSRWASGAVAVPQRLPAALRHLIEVPPGMREAGDFFATMLTPADRPRLFFANNLTWGEEENNLLWESICFGPEGMVLVTTAPIRLLPAMRGDGKGGTAAPHHIVPEAPSWETWRDHVPVSLLHGGDSAEHVSKRTRFYILRKVGE